MLIDWFTVCAQALNFLILIWLMKRFLYRPILAAIDAREKRIAKELSDANAMKAEAQKAHDEFALKNQEFDKNRSALLSKATEEVNSERARLLDQAKNAAAAEGAKQLQVMKSAAHNLSQSLIRRTAQEVLAISRNALTDLAGATLEERMSETFMRRLQAMDAKSKSLLAAAIKSSSDPVLVQSTFDLGEQQHAAIQNALNVTFSMAVKVRFETAPDLISGIELTANGQKLAWSIAHYLAAMEKSLDETLNCQAESNQIKTQPQNGNNNGNHT